ncbi:hypothetical protein D9M68_314160 [compost metagenome]
MGIAKDRRKQFIFVISIPVNFRHDVHVDSPWREMPFQKVAYALSQLVAVLEQFEQSLFKVRLVRQHAEKTVEGQPAFRKLQFKSLKFLANDTVHQVEVAFDAFRTIIMKFFGNFLIRQAKFLAVKRAHLFDKLIIDYRNDRRNSVLCDPYRTVDRKRKSHDRNMEGMDRRSSGHVIQFKRIAKMGKPVRLKDDKYQLRRGKK